MNKIYNMLANILIVFTLLLTVSMITAATRLHWERWLDDAPVVIASPAYRLIASTHYLAFEEVVVNGIVSLRELFHSDEIQQQTAVEMPNSEVGNVVAKQNVDWHNDPFVDAYEAALAYTQVLDQIDYRDQEGWLGRVRAISSEEGIAWAESIFIPGVWPQLIEAQSVYKVVSAEPVSITVFGSSATWCVVTVYFETDHPHPGKTSIEYTGNLYMVRENLELSGKWLFAGTFTDEELRKLRNSMRQVYYADCIDTDKPGELCEQYVIVSQVNP